jgi:hypothetical protein
MVKSDFHSVMKRLMPDHAHERDYPPGCRLPDAIKRVLFRVPAGFALKPGFVGFGSCAALRLAWC